MKYHVSFHLKTWYLHTWKDHRCHGYIINRAFCHVSFSTKTWYLHAWKDHCCCGYIINHTFCTDLVFHWCLYNKQNITWPLSFNWKYKISPLVLKNISLVCCAHSWNIFQHSKRNFISLRCNVISSIYFMHSVVTWYLNFCMLCLNVSEAFLEWFVLLVSLSLSFFVSFWFLMILPHVHAQEKQLWSGTHVLYKTDALMRV